MPRYLLDTNTYQFVIDGLHGVNDKLITVPAEQVFLSSIAIYETIINGWQRQLKRVETTKRKTEIEEVHQAIIDEIRFLSKFQIEPYSSSANDKYVEIYKAVKRDRIDCKIAAQAIVSNMIVVTDNVSDFRFIQESFPELRFENWATRTS